MNLTDTIGTFRLWKPTPTATDEASGFRTFFGVFLPSVLSIFGVILYLRLGWILGNVGLFETLIIIAFSSSITFITGLSISSIATNRDVGSGGAYFMISRSFGKELGCAIGFSLFLAQATGIAFYVEGFSESVHALFPFLNPTAIDVSTIFILTGIVFISANVALKTQLFIFLLIVASLLSIIFLTPISLDIPDVVPAISTSLPFWAAFAIFFPAVTGIEAGFAMSGDLKNPRKSLPLGTLSAVLLGFIVYSYLACLFTQRFPVDSLKNDYLILQHTSPFPLLIYFGIWGATLSSAIGGLLGAPRTMQALALDGVIPKFFGKGYGVSQEPRIASCATFLIAIVSVYFGNINIISPILSMFFLISYGMLNLATSLEGAFGNPSWRPTFRFHWSISLLGSILCLFAMMMINVIAMFISLGLICILYTIMKSRKMSKGWDDIRQGVFQFFSRFAVYRLASLGPSARSWRPNFLVFTGSPTKRPYLIDFANAITKNKGFLTIATMLPSERAIQQKADRLQETMQDFMEKQKIQALVEVMPAESIYSGMTKMISHYGMGPITPNTILLGDCAKKEFFTDFTKLIYTAKDAGKNVVIFKEKSIEEQELITAWKRGSIDIWWDDDFKENSELMLVLAHMLQTSHRWRKSNIEIKTIVSNENAREHRMSYFNNFFAESRLKAEVKVLVIPEFDTNSMNITSHFSQESGLVIMGMRPPKDGEPPEEWSKYYENILKGTNELERVVFVISFQDLDLSQIFD